MGAKVTSVDISENQLEIAKERANKIGLKISFSRADITNLSELEENSFDFVYTGGHISVWISDMNKYYGEAVRILKPSCLFIVNDYHPFRRIWHHEKKHLEMEEGYFNRGPFKYTSDDGLPQFEFHWTVTDHIQAVIDAGCQIIKVDEHGTENEDWVGIDFKKLPRYLFIVGKKRL